MRKLVFPFLALSFFSLQCFGWTHLSGNTFGWKQKKLTFYVNTANCTLSENELFAIIDRALAAWNGIPSTDLELVRSSTPATDGDAELRAGTATQVPLVVCSTHLADYSQDPNAILGFMPFSQIDSEGYINYSGLVLNAEVGSAAEISTLSASEVELVVGHEIGHVLGLGHSADRDALMYFQLNKTFLLITQDDMDGITQLYPRNEFLAGAFGCSSVHQRETRLPGLGLLGFFLFTVLVIIVARKKFSIEPLPEPGE
jgi:hypothetical protein